MLEIKDFTKIYPNGKIGAEKINLKIEKGDIFAFIGHNGAGKTTTIKSIVGINDITNGDITIDGISIKDNPLEFKKQIAYIPDNPDIYTQLTGIQYINFIADIFKVPQQERKEKIEKYAKLLEIYKDLNTVIGNYSHGMKQKLTLISAFVHNPKVLILDEPFVGLDPKASFIVKDIMKEFAKNGGAIFFSTHVLEVAEKLCNKVAIIKDGKIIANGTMSTIKKDKSLEKVFMETANE
ncbi:MAG: ABC transporter ATP-binding protein [Clostridiales bacterium]|nr:ABC transporter ATP-binding protein [Clostridiales bacterium]